MITKEFKHGYKVEMFTDEEIDVNIIPFYSTHPAEEYVLKLDNESETISPCKFDKVDYNDNNTEVLCHINKCLTARQYNAIIDSDAFNEVVETFVFLRCLNNLLATTTFQAWCCGYFNNRIDSINAYAIVIDSVEDSLFGTIYEPLIKNYVDEFYMESFGDICRTIMEYVFEQPIKYCGHEVILNMARYEVEEYLTASVSELLVRIYNLDSLEEECD